MGDVNESTKPQGAGTAVVTEGAWQDRRRLRRLQVSLHARIRSFGPEQKQLEEVRPTTDFNRAGFYFTTQLAHYSLGMKVVLALPYSPHAQVEREYIGRVVRLEPLCDGLQGVAVQILY